MTKEEAKEYILECLDRSEAEEIIEALDPKNCEDAVSRKAVLDLVNADWEYEGLEEEVNNLPSVKPVACIAKVTFNKEDMQKIVDEKVKELTLENAR